MFACYVELELVWDHIKIVTVEKKKHIKIVATEKPTQDENVLYCEEDTCWPFLSNHYLRTHYLTFIDILAKIRHGTRDHSLGSGLRVGHDQGHISVDFWRLPGEPYDGLRICCLSGLSFSLCSSANRWITLDGYGTTF